MKLRAELFTKEARLERDRESVATAKILLMIFARGRTGITCVALSRTS